MVQHLAAIGILSWALLGPAVCEAACNVAQESAHQECHSAPVASEEQEPKQHSEECCKEVLFAVQSAPVQLEVVAGLSLAAPEYRDPREDQTVSVVELPRPPDLPNSPYLRVTPPRLVYEPSALS